MGKGAYVGVNGIARKIKGGYIGVDGVARKIKKAYVGVGNIARLMWSADRQSLVYAGSVSISQAKQGYGVAATRDYALFAGGNTGSVTSSVDIISDTFVRTTTTIENAREKLVGASAGTAAVFCSGFRYSSSATQYDVDFFNNASLTRSYAANSVNARQYHAGASFGRYAVFSGGRNSSTSFWNSVEAYDEDFVHITSMTALSDKKYYHAGTATDAYAIFAGGRGDSGGVFASANAYNQSLVAVTISNLSQARDSLAATTVGNYALFAGGAQFYNTVDAYDQNLVRTTIDSLSVKRSFNGDYTGGTFGAASVGGYAIFAGGNIATSGSSNVTNVVDVYDDKLVKSVGTSLATARTPGACTLKKYALFGAGNKSNILFSVSGGIEAYQVV